MSGFSKAILGRVIAPFGLLALFAVEGAAAQVQGLGGVVRPGVPLQGSRLPVSGQDTPEGVGKGERFGECPPEISGDDLPDPDDPTSGSSGKTLSGPGLGGWAEDSQPQGQAAPPGQGPQWENDILIHAGPIWRHADWDQDQATADLYIVVDRNGPSPDTSLIYRSTDEGATWSVWGRVINSDGNIYSPKIRLARDGSGETWVCVVGIWEEPSAGFDRNLWMGRKLASGGAWTWSMVDDNVEEADADADVGSGASIYVVYIPVGTGNDIWAARHTLSGAWQDNQSLFQDPEVAFPSPQIAAGAGGDVAVTFIDTRLSTNDEVRVKRSTDGGVTWLGSQQVSNNSGGFPLSWTDIASSHGGTQTGWIFVTFDVSSSGQGLNIGYYYSTDSGATWDYGGLVGSSTADEYQSTLRADKDIGAVTLAYSAGAMDSVMVSWASPSNPAGFVSVQRVDDGGSLVVFPVAGWLTRDEYPWSGALFSTWDGSGVRDVYLDWLGNGHIWVNVDPDARIIPRGGTLGMTVRATNASSVAQPVEFWTNVTLPNGNTWPADETLVGPIAGTIPAHTTLSGRITHRVPGDAPLNTFRYNSHLGPSFPDWSSKLTFNFTIVAASDMARAGEGAGPLGGGQGDLGMGVEGVSFPLIENTLFLEGRPEVASGPSGKGQQRGPAAASLLRVSPNPFTPSTTISFRIAPSEAGEGGAEADHPVVLRIYNLRGELVRALVDASLSPGSHSVSWDGRDERGNACAPGVYFLSLRAGEDTVTRKLVIAQ